MGVPKFFRWISERYPLCSQLITENGIPEFDNLYLDMNGIIHNCSRPPEGMPSFTEEDIFTSIFTYIDVLFHKIKPQKLFFMAVDGVAPRAKMNQQRARRYRSAKDAQTAREKAIKSGELLETSGEQWDSNCITPGTEFMIKLAIHLKYFIAHKISEDSYWRHVNIVLSGPDVPGEGEHKIMDYIRSQRLLPSYDPNTRHCLYGLDADLIMLGLLTHEPHFALLREEVQFGKQNNNNKRNTADGQTFFLLHLSLTREYLDLEFKPSSSKMSFPYDLERIIDDFILIMYFIGNDFIPNLPGLTIGEGGLKLIFHVYKGLLTTMDGYLNDFGTVSWKRMRRFIEGLVVLEDDMCFEQPSSDLDFMNAKSALDDSIIKGYLWPQQKELLATIQTFFADKKEKTLIIKGIPPSSGGMDGFLERIKRDFRELIDITVKRAEDEICLCKMSLPDGVLQSISSDIFASYDRLETRTMEEYLSAKQRLAKEEKRAKETWKQRYYQTKFHVDIVQSPEFVSSLRHSYIEGIQWILLYYYAGVQSWSWFYPHHYAPLISDMIALEKDEEISIANFTKGTPFTAYQQLMGVLPPLSQKLIPTIYRPLMIDANSPIIDFYPKDFLVDRNGKKNDWESVILIPFIDETRLLNAMVPLTPLMSDEDKKRNTIGNAWLFQYNAKNPIKFPSSLPGVFPDISDCPVKITVFHIPETDAIALKRGLLTGARHGVHAMPGFPTLHSLPFESHIAFHKVNIFNQESQNESMVITLTARKQDESMEKILSNRLEKSTFTGWPYVQPSFVTAITSATHWFEMQQGSLVKRPLTQEETALLSRVTKNIETTFSTKYAVVIGQIDYLFHVLPLLGMKRLNSGALVKHFARRGDEQHYPLQTVLEDIPHADPRFEDQAPPSMIEEYPSGTTIFYLGAPPYYGCRGVTQGDPSELSLQLKLMTSLCDFMTPQLCQSAIVYADRLEKWLPSFVVARQLSISPLCLSRLTSSLYVQASGSTTRINVGLNLKFESKGECQIGYARKSLDRGVWEYSRKAVELIKLYISTFPAILQAANNESIQDDQLLRSMKSWTKEHEDPNAMRGSFESFVLSPEGIQYLAKITDDEIKRRSITTKSKEIIVPTVPSQYVLKPSHAKHRLGHQNFSLGDRVVCLSTTGSVPLGLHGTIIAIGMGNHGDELDVLFDEPFMRGSTLGKRCPNNRGSRLSRHSLLNLTWIQPPIEEYMTTNSMSFEKPTSTAIPIKKPTAPSHDSISSSAPVERTVLPKSKFIHQRVDSAESLKKSPPTSNTKKPIDLKNIDRISPMNTAIKELKITDHPSTSKSTVMTEEVKLTWQQRQLLSGERKPSMKK